MKRIRSAVFRRACEMKLCEITIEPVSAFGSSIRGDTLFGQLCWEIAHDPKWLGMTIEEFLADYETHPRIVCSSAFRKFTNPENGNVYFAFKRPDLPLRNLFPSGKPERGSRVRERKELKRKRWMIVPEALPVLEINKLEYADDENIFDKLYLPNRRNIKARELANAQLRYHNTIDRRSGTTGEGKFAPFALRDEFHLPGIQLSIFLAYDEPVTLDRLFKRLTRIGKFGYGRDASTGLGKFEMVEFREIQQPESAQANSCYTLSPCVPEKNCYFAKYFTPFVRFGRHGDELAKSGNPFKNPVVMADEGAVLFPAPECRGGIFSKPFLGSALQNLSRIMPQTVGQGYALYLPARVEV